MYDKRMLARLPLPRLSKTRTDEVFSDEHVGYIARSALVIDRNLLMVAFFERESAANGFELPTVVLYITKKEYITRVMENGIARWSTARIRDLLFPDWSYRQNPHVACLYHADEDRIRQFLRHKRPSCYSGSNGIDFYIEGYQNELLKMRRVKRWADQKKEYDVVMAQVPPEPPGFRRWVDDYPMKAARYVFFEHINSRLTKAFCSRCKSDYLLDAGIARHNKEGVCPHCGDQIRYKAARRSTSLMYVRNAVLIQKTKTGGLVMRYYWLSRHYQEYSYSEINYRNHKEYVTEEARLFLDKEGNITGAYKLGWANFLGGLGFLKSRDVIFGEDRTYSTSFLGYNGGESVKIWFRRAWLYPYNLRGIIKEFSLPYSVLDGLKEHETLDVTTYLGQHIRYPVLSSFDALDLSALKDDILNGKSLEVYHPKGSLHKRLGLSKEQLQMVKEHRFTTFQVNLITRSIITPSLENILWIGDNGISLRSVTTILQYTTFHKMQKYIAQQVEKQQKKKNNRIFQYDHRSPACIMAEIWADYLKMSSTLEFKTRKWRILFPKDVKDQHDKVAALIKVKHDPKFDAKIKAIFPALDKKYSYSNERYFLQPIKDFDSIVEEGAELMHCVASSGYYKGHVNGTGLIFQVRKKREPNKAFYTMEFDHKQRRVKQLQGYRSCSPTKPVAAFRDEWLAAKKFRSPAKKTKEAA